MRSFTIIVHDGEPDEGGYWAEVEELTACFASADSLDELEVDVRNAIASYLLALEDLGEPIPEGRADVSDGARRWVLPVAL